MLLPVVSSILRVLPTQHSRTLIVVEQGTRRFGSKGAISLQFESFQLSLETLPPFLHYYSPLMVSVALLMLLVQEVISRRRLVFVCDCAVLA